MRSVRLDAGLERRLEEVAAREGVAVSAVIRSAVEKHCDSLLGRDLSNDLEGIVGAVESEGGRARATGQAFRKALVARRQR